MQGCIGNLVAVEPVFSNGPEELTASCNQVNFYPACRGRNTWTHPWRGVTEVGIGMVSSSKKAKVISGQPQGFVDVKGMLYNGLLK